jgi:hypothetical protein
MGKKKQRATQVSKGEVGRPQKSRSKLDEDYPARRMMNQMRAFQQGKNVVLTIPNPNANETNKPFIRVNAREVWKGGKR